mmetsp:Transcript_17560/g.19872  ORF Transcript_17560/g.19872 Transcript_17560/m.19872 type:complete len:823 (+) Transcript_17560:534-3002(+)
MGTYLSTPVTEKCDEFGQSLTVNLNNNDDEDVHVDWGVVDMQGWRKSMEDAHTAVTNVPLTVFQSDGNDKKQQQPRHARVFGVYDGHGGAEVARFCQYYFVSVLTNQPTWVAHNTLGGVQHVNTNNDNNTFTNAIGVPIGLPLVGDDDRVPSPPPPPPSSITTVTENGDSTDVESDRYDGNGNEDGYRHSHLPQAMETPVGKSLREAFHAMDRLINDPTRRTEISALRSTKTAKGETKTLARGFASIPVIVPMSQGPAPPQFYVTHKQNLLARMINNNNTTAASSSSVIVEEEAAVVVPDNAAAAAAAAVKKQETTATDTSAAALAYGIAEEAVEKEKQQAQADLSLSTVMTPEQAAAVKREIEDFEKNNQDQEDNDTAAADDDSNAVVGLEEAAVLDANIDTDADTEADDRADDGSGVDESGGAVIAPPPSPTATASTAATTTATTSPHPDPIIPGGKVTTMLQKILSLGVGAATKRADTALPEDDGTDEAYDPDVSALLPTTTTTTADNQDTPTGGIVEYPNSAEVPKTDVHHPSVIHQGRLACNLPDHPIHAGATAVVAVLTGQILTVANAGDSRAVLCRRKPLPPPTSSSSSTDQGQQQQQQGVEVGGHYAYPLSYDHKPSQTHEMDRILLGGGFVNHFGRINGNLNLSRSIGDLKYKQVPGIPPEDQMITAEPDIMQIVLHEEDEFLLLGCDGIWDCLTNEQAVNFVQARIETQSPIDIGAAMLDEIVSDDPRITQGIGGDNMTIMIIDFHSATRTRNGGTGTTTTRGQKKKSDTDTTTTTTTSTDTTTTTTPSSTTDTDTENNVDSTKENTTIAAE